MQLTARVMTPYPYSTHRWLCTQAYASELGQQRCKLGGDEQPSHQRAARYTHIIPHLIRALHFTLNQRFSGCVVIYTYMYTKIKTLMYVCIQPISQEIRILERDRKGAVGKIIGFCF